VEHRDHEAVDVLAERVLRGVAADELVGGDLLAVGGEQVLLHHRGGAALVDHRHVDVPGRGAGLGLRGELLVDLLRAGVARAGAHRLDRDPWVQLLEARREEGVDVVDHVLVAGGDDVERGLGRGRQAEGGDGRESEQSVHRGLLRRERSAKHRAGR
jgi:hypothetical protein